MLSSIISFGAKIGQFDKLAQLVAQESTLAAGRQQIIKQSISAGSAFSEKNEKFHSTSPISQDDVHNPHQ